MNNDNFDFTEAIKNWIQKAEDDIKWTESNIRGEIFYGACFTAQQAVEKILKAYLLKHENRTPRIHNLRALLKRCELINSAFSKLNEEISPLDAYYIQTRYPDFSDYVGYTEEKAIDALERAKFIVNFVKKKIEEN